MSDKKNNPPIETHRDGAVSAKVWRNFTKEGKPIYSVTFQRTYTNSSTKQIAESHSFGGTDILKISPLANEAYRTIGKMRELDRAEPMQAPQLDLQETAQSDGLAHQRDAAMSSTTPTQEPNQPAMRTPTFER